MEFIGQAPVNFKGRQRLRMTHKTVSFRNRPECYKKGTFDFDLMEEKAIGNEVTKQ